MKPQALVPACPICGFSSIYTDGDAPCSVRCALKSARDCHHIHDVPLTTALSLALEEANARGLPQEPHLRDIRELKYRYVLVDEVKRSKYWSIDRDLLSSGLNVEYSWLNNGKTRYRIYRFAPSLLPKLPESMLDYKLRNNGYLSHYSLGCYWHFLRAK